MDGLAAYVQEQMQADPFSGVVHVFRAKRSDKVKLLFWDGTGVCLLIKRLEGAKLRWLAIQDGVMRLSPAQLSALLEGLDWSRVHMRRVREAGAAVQQTFVLIGQPGLVRALSGVLQVDGYVAYRQLTKPERDGGPLVLANCWVHFRRQFYDIAKGGSAPIGTEALQRFAALYAIEDEIRGQGADQRRAVRQERTRPLVDRFECWLKQQLAIISKGSTLADAIRYGLNHWQGLCRFLDDGRIEMDSNTVERSMGRWL